MVVRHSHSSSQSKLVHHRNRVAVESRQPVGRQRIRAVVVVKERSRNDLG
jgi:hypothetical protein